MKVNIMHPFKYSMSSLEITRVFYLWIKFSKKQNKFMLEIKKWNVGCFYDNLGSVSDWIKTITFLMLVLFCND